MGGECRWAKKSEIEIVASVAVGYGLKWKLDKKCVDTHTTHTHIASIAAKQIHWNLRKITLNSLEAKTSKQWRGHPEMKTTQSQSMCFQAFLFLCWKALLLLPLSIFHCLIEWSRWNISSVSKHGHTGCGLINQLKIFFSSEEKRLQLN